MTENSKEKYTSFIITDSNNIENMIENFVKILNSKSIKEFNRACKESNKKFYITVINLFFLKN